MSEELRRLRKGSSDDWPSLALLEFTVALAKTMAANDMKQKDLARALDVSPPYISSVMAGNENLTIEQMSRLAEAAGGCLHLTIAPHGLRVRWVEDALEEPCNPTGEGTLFGTGSEVHQGSRGSLRHGRREGQRSKRARHSTVP